MKQLHFKVALAVAVAWGLGGAPAAHAGYISLEINSVNFGVAPGVTNDAALVFTGTGNTFAFQDSVGGGNYDFRVNNVPNQPGLPPPNLGTGSAIGLLGRIGGSYTIGPIQSTSIGGLTVQTAPVTSSGGSFSIDDGLGSSLVGDLSFAEIVTTTNSSGGSGLITAAGTFNLTNISYGGGNADLVTLRNLQPGSLSISFNFNPGRTLTQLTADGTTTPTNYNGDLYAVTPTVAAVPAPAGLVLALTAIPGLSLGAWLRRRSVAAAA